MRDVQIHWYFDMFDLYRYWISMRDKMVPLEFQEFLTVNIKGYTLFIIPQMYCGTLITPFEDNVKSSQHFFAFVDCI